MEVVQGSSLEIKDLTEVARPFLSHASTMAMSRKSDRILVLEGSKTYEAIYIVRRFKASSESKAAQAVAEEVNKLASAGLIHSVLAPISSIKLARRPGEEDSIAVFCYPLVPQDRMAEVNSLVQHVPMERFGLPDEDLSLDLPEGDFYAVVNLSPTRIALSAGEQSEDVLEEEIQRYLSVLPRGTTVVAKRACSVVSLAIPYEVIFRNPLMKDFRKVELTDSRQSVKVDGKIEVFDLLTKVTYVRRDGTMVGG
jgi:hypothetical protein